jgi:hypothetical protein
MATGWLPLILLCISASFIAVALIVVAIRQWKNKRLVRQIFTLDADLKAERTTAASEKEKTAAALAKLGDIKSGSG